MKTVDYSRVLNDALQLCGLDRRDFNDATFIQLRDFASTRLRIAWEYDRWPDLIRYAETAVLEDNKMYYCVKPAGAGEILGIWTENPLISTRALGLDYTLYTTDTEERLVLQGENSNNVFIEYRIAPTDLFGDVWSSSTTFYAGSQCYFDSGSNTGSYQPVSGKPQAGNFYVCLQTNTNTNPETSTANWQKVKIPYIFGNYVSRAVFGDYLRSEGQFDSARIAEAEAKSFLDMEIDKIVRQQGQVQKINFIQPY